MKRKRMQEQKAGSAKRKAPAVPEPEAFLEEAKREPKRLLLMDHIKTIGMLRMEKKFTWRAIAAWLNERGFDTDHSAVYRTYLASIPESQRSPDEDWSDVKAEDQ
jgi:hypothetical protein